MIFHEYLSDAVEEALKQAAQLEAVLRFPEEMTTWEHVNYGETRRSDYQLLTLKGKPTKKYFHVSIYRIDSGRYELTCYVL